MLACSVSSVGVHVRNDQHCVWAIFWASIYKTTVYDVYFIMSTLGPFESVSVSVCTHVDGQFEKLNDKLDVIGSLLMQGVGDTVVVETEPLGPVQVESAEQLATLIKAQHDETRQHISREEKQTRKHVALCAIFLMLFIVALFEFYNDHAPVCSTPPPVPPVCAPAPECAASLPSVWDNYLSCARIFT